VLARDLQLDADDFRATEYPEQWSKRQLLLDAYWTVRNPDADCSSYPAADAVHRVSVDAEASRWHAVEVAATVLDVDDLAVKTADAV
jgi:hypothetical protein